MNSSIIDKLSVITEEEQMILEGQKEIDKSRYSVGSEMVVDAEKLLEKGRLIQIRPHTRFAYFPKHRHNYIEVIYMCQGETVHIIDGKEIVLREGELLFLNMDAVQEVKPAGRDDIAVNFIILPQFFDKVFELIGEENSQFRSYIIECLMSSGRNHESFLHFKVGGILPIENLVENMIWSILDGNPRRRYINQVNMGLLFLYLMNYTDRLDVSDKSEERDIMISVLRYVEENYVKGSLAELAKELSYDMTWLSRKIKSACGENFRELIQNKRLSKAEFLLRTTGMAVTDIAESVGYDNMSFFYRKFKEKYGVSPNEYRKNR